MAEGTAKISTPRAVQTKNTREKIFKAAAEILIKNGYAYLTVSNICAVAGVSNGTFFYHFKTKEELLTYYTYENFAEYRQAHGFEEAVRGLTYDKKILTFYFYWADYMVSTGLDFFSSFYSTSNRSLDVRLWNTRQPQIVWNYPGECLIQAKNEGLLREGVSISGAGEALATIMKGVAFDWCLSRGVSDMRRKLDEIMIPYLNSIF